MSRRPGRYVTDKKIDMKSLRRLLSYVFGRYGFLLVIVFLCICTNSVSTVIVNTYMARLIDTVILPGLTVGYEAVKGDLYAIIRMMILFNIAGILAVLIYPQIMARVGQGTIKALRDQMFTKMETLPVRYFDSRTHGEIMSTYTNDVGTIRMLVGQTIPSALTSLLTIASIFVTMLNYSLWMTLFVLLMVGLMLRITKSFGSKSTRYMKAQQKSVAEEEGYIEEMMEGMKVVKVFTHEEEAKKKFDEVNEKLFQDSNIANATANSLMPVLANVGNIMYVLLAVIGGLLVILKIPNVSLKGVSMISIGVIISFLALVRQLSGSVSQISSQVSTIAMALAGSDRVFALIDEKSEEDQGYVMLVNATRNENGALVEALQHTG